MLKPWAVDGSPNSTIETPGKRTIVCTNRSTFNTSLTLESFDAGALPLPSQGFKSVLPSQNADRFIHGDHDKGPYCILELVPD